MSPLVLILASVFISSGMAADESVRRSFDVPKGEASRALKVFSQQAGRGVIFSTDGLKGIRTNRVLGVFTPREALDQMIAGTDLVVGVEEKTGAFAVRKGTADPKALGAAPTTEKSVRPLDKASSPQAANSNSATPPADDVVTLSPFEVQTSQDTGYVGQDTLAGSRLRTNLRDVAAAISPMTADFLRDIAATNIEGAVEYGVSTRMETDDARAAGPVGDTYSDTIRAIRIRGLPGGGRSINFFGAPGEVDLYMVDQVEVSRGPNSILFGVGSPAGKLNVSTKQALTNRNACSLSQRTDSWGGMRAIADANLALLPKVVGVRAIMLHGREESWRAAGHNDQDRIFLATKWQPNRKTTIKAEFEGGNVNRFVPRPYFSNDLLSTWIASGQPMFNNFSATYVPGRPGNGTVGTPGTPICDTGANKVTGIAERYSGDWVVYSSQYPYAQNYRQFTVAEHPATALIPHDFEHGRLNPSAVLESNWVGGVFRVRSGSLFIQRELARDLNLEFAFNRQTSRSETRNLAQWNLYGLAADTNLFLPNGTLKPKNQLYYFEMSPDHRFSSSQVNQGRFALSYEKKWSDWVDLRLAGLGEMAYANSRFEILQQYWFKGPAITSGGAFSPTPETTPNQVKHRYYVSGPEVLLDRNFHIPGPYDLSGAVPYQDPSTGTVSNIYAREIIRAQGNANYADRDTGAYMGVAQAFLLKNRIVVTYGYRNDRQKTWVGVPFRDPAAEAIAANTGVWTPADPRNSAPSVFSGYTHTAGAVAHLNSWLSAFVNGSSSISTPGLNYITPHDPRQTSMADLPPSPSGKTTDYGFKLSLPRNRLFLTATRYHTVSKNEFGSSGFANTRTNIANIWSSLADSTTLSPEDTAFARRQVEVMNQVLGYTQDSESRGHELEIVGQPLPGWSISANYSRSETVRSNIAREFRAYLDFHKPMWLKYRDFSITQNASQARPQRAPSYTDWRSPAEIAATGDFTINSDSINEVIADTEQLFFDNPHVFEGRRFVGDPLHNVNLRTKYDFRGGALHGLTLGLGARWRLGAVAGTRTEYTLPSGADYTAAWNGRTMTRVTNVNANNQAVYDVQLGYAIPLKQRRVRWMVQLNANNVLDQREMIVNNTHPTTLAPLTYRYQDPRQLVVTNTLSF